MKKIKISALAIAVTLSATGIYGTTKNGNQILTAAPSQPVSGTSSVLTQEDEPSLNCMMGNTHLNICTFVTKSDAPNYTLGHSISREHIKAIIHSYNP